MNLVIAEDEPALRENLQWMLELEGFSVRAAANGQEALSLCLQETPDLLLTDVMMPELDGYSLVRALRQHQTLATLPIIMLTAKADRSDVRAAMNRGADDYLTKPYRREELLEAIHARLAHSARLGAAAQRLQTEARQRDPLTLLPGREWFTQMLSTCVASDRVLGFTSGMVCLGLDGFSKVNDSLGAAIGDRVLREVAARLLEHTGTGADAPCGQTPCGTVVARLGSDLFAVRLRNVPQASSLEEPMRAMLAELARPYLIEGHTLFLTGCAGASQFPVQAATAHALLLNAESALHHAKARGPGSALLFDPAMNQQVARRLRLHNDLHRALDLQELQVYYQPQICIATGNLTGFEALMRWQHPTMGWISPAEFIPVAEESGIIVQLGAWVMRTAAQQAAHWLAQGHTNFRMAVNLSVRQFVANNLPDLVRSVLQETGLPPHMLELEVTESLALHSVATTLSTLHACKELGVQLAMDDFGTGYSSLSYLKRYPINTLKIDQAFIRNLHQDPGDAAITQAIVAMAHSFGMSVTAEGVETMAQLEFLRNLGCENFQGYLFSPPVPPAQAQLGFAGYHPPPETTAPRTP